MASPNVDVIRRPCLCTHAMLVDAWKSFAARRPPKPACCFGAALFALIEAAELGSKTQSLIEHAVVASRGLHETPSAQTVEIISEFVTTATTLVDPCHYRACILEIMRRVSNCKSAEYQIARLEEILRADRTPASGQGGGSE